MMPQTLFTTRTRDIAGRDFLWQSLLPGSGPSPGVTFASWGAAVVAVLAELYADVTDCGLDATDIARLSEVADSGGGRLDEIAAPALLHGDLWTPTIMLAWEEPTRTITGFWIMSEVAWGDSAADWAIYEAGRRADIERAAFWESYGEPETSRSARWRAALYRARQVGILRLERFRLGRMDRVQDGYREVEALLSLLAD